MSLVTNLSAHNFSNIMMQFFKILTWLLTITLLSTNAYSQNISKKYISLNNKSLIKISSNHGNILQQRSSNNGFLRACPDIVVNCGDVLTGLTNQGYGADFNGSWECASTLTGYISTTGEDIIIAITPPINGEVEITMSNATVSGTFDAIDVFIIPSCPPPPGPNTTHDCVVHFQFDVASQTFVGSNAPTEDFAVSANNTYYILIGHQGGDTITFDISFTCTSTGIAADEDCDPANDPDQNGLYTTVDGNLATCINPLTTTTATICHTIYLQNIGWEWLKYVTVQTGSCITAVSNPTPTTGDGGFHDCCPLGFFCFAPGNDWQPTISGTTINWSFEACANPNWGDGYAEGNNYTCLDYTFCYTATIDPTCTDPNGFNDIITFIDDGVGGTGNTSPSQVVLGSGLGNCNPLSSSNTLRLTRANVFGGYVELRWFDLQPENADKYVILYKSDLHDNFMPLEVMKATGSIIGSYVTNISKMKFDGSKIIFRIQKVAKDGNTIVSNEFSISVVSPDKISIVKMGAKFLVLFNEDNPSAVTIFTNDGKEILSYSENDIGNRRVIELPGNLPEGLYFIKAAYDDGFVVKKYHIR